MSKDAFAARSAAVHLGRNQDSIPGVNPPIGMNSTYLADAPVSYARIDSSLWRAFEEVIGELEGGEAVAFSSGQAATAAVMSLLRPDSSFALIGDCYTGTRLLAKARSEQGFFRLSLVDPESANSAETLLDSLGASPVVNDSPSTLFWLETPSNPMLRLYSIREWAKARDAVAGSLLVVDNTFASPVLQRPLDHGADVVMHSASKALSGHSDVIMGVLVAKDHELAETLRSIRTLFGSIPGQFESYLALRGVRTLFVRFERAQANAALLADRLEDRLGAGLVHYPGLSGHPGSSIVASQMSGSGYMLSFDLGTTETAEGFCRGLVLATYATSLGGVETLVERRARHKGEDGTPPGLVRVSVGIEDVEDLWDDFDRSLSGVGL